MTIRGAGIESGTLSAIAPASHGPRVPHSYRRFTAALALCVALPSVAMVSAIAAIDPYYLFGTTGWHGINLVRPRYEPYVLVAKPYQVARLRPTAASFGSSRVEVGIDPRHPGWRSKRVFNYALPSSNSYGVMLAFLDAQAHGMRRAVIGLDFFAYNINFPLAVDLDERRFGSAAEEFVDFLTPKTTAAGRDGTPLSSTRFSDAWNEELYLAVNPDVTAAIARAEFVSGRQHFELAGRTERRLGAYVPAEWDEAAYLSAYPDVANAVRIQTFVNGYHHYLAAGRVEGRLSGYRPAAWDERKYLDRNPGARARIAFGIYRDGYVHYAGVGRRHGIADGLPAESSLQALSASPPLQRIARPVGELFRLVFSTSAVADVVSTALGQASPASFDGLGMRVWHGQEQVLRGKGGPRGVFQDKLQRGDWGPLLVQPRYAFCFQNPANGVSMFDPYQFMLRKAYAAGTEAHLFITPLNTAVRELISALGLAERYDDWLRQLVRINEEEASRAGRPPFQLLDFSDVNTITRESFPAQGDPSPMRWFWESSHYRKELGDLILDRIFGYSNPSRALPPDFGVKLSGKTVDGHIARNRDLHRQWVAQEAALHQEIMDAVRHNRDGNGQAQATCW